jgi:hypothetical protein
MPATSAARIDGDLLPNTGSAAPASAFGFVPAAALPSGNAGSTRRGGGE